MYPSNLLEGMIYVAGISFLFFTIPTLVMFALTQYVCDRIEKAGK